MTSGLSTTENARATVRYSDEQRRALYSKILRLRFGPFELGEKRATWDAIADALHISRTTLYAWQQLEDYKQAEIRYRKLLREEGRTTVAGMGRDALDHLFYLMTNARSEFVQLESAREIIKLTNIEKELEEAEHDANQELIEFQKVLLKRKAERAKLREAGFDPDSIIDVPVKPGGILPDIVQAENRIVAERFSAET